jgi:glucose-6-phosphate dehydrogenase assembly protein OpcA
MATALVDRRSKASTAATVDDDLHGLWLEAARDAPVARAVMANLIVLREGADGDELDIPLDEVVRRHPSRVILLRRGRAHVEPVAHASVSVVTFGPPAARYGIEEIAVRTTCADASLPSIVRRYVHGDVPTTLWWAEDVSRLPPIPALVAMARQLVFDSRRWRDVRAGVRALAPLLDDPDAPELADVNWRRLTSMRYAIVHAADTLLRGATTIERVSIRHRPGDGALAWLLVGWLGARLRWTAGAVPARVQEARHGDEILSATLDDVTATMDASRIVVRSNSSGQPFSVAARQESGSDAVVAELSTLRPDRCLHDALAALARLFAAETGR